MNISSLSSLPSAPSSPPPFSSVMTNSHSLTHPHTFSHSSCLNCTGPRLFGSSVVTPTTSRRCLVFKAITATHVCPGEAQQRRTRRVDKSSVVLSEAFSEDELWAAASLRVRSFYEFSPSTFRVQDHRMYLTEREFEALKERVAGKREGFKRVSCINATVPLTEIQHCSDDLCDSCRFSEGGEDRVVVGTLDLNQCIHLPDEIPGKRPEGIGADFARAYLSNVCVAKELHRNGLGYALMEKSKLVAQEWGISDLYVHVAVDNEPAKNLYMKSGFIFESEEPPWQARFLDRPRRLLLWTGLPISYEL